MYGFLVMHISTKIYIVSRSESFIGFKIINEGSRTFNEQCELLHQNPKIEFIAKIRITVITLLGLMFLVFRVMGNDK